MKQNLLFFFVFINFLNAVAQDYQISFSGTGVTNSLDTVIVENLTKSISDTLKGDEILHLVGTVGMNAIHQNFNNGLKINQNPLSNDAIIKFETSITCFSSIELFDITGRQVCNYRHMLNKGMHEFMLSNLNKGPYLLKVSSNNILYSSKFISTGYGNAHGSVVIKYLSSTYGTEDNFNYVTNNNSTKKSQLVYSLVEMKYSDGDILKFIGISGVYRTVYMLKPSTSSLFVVFNFVSCTDIDNNHYVTVKIGDQTWMGENLKTTKFNDGTEIPHVMNNSDWANLYDSPAYCYFNNDEGYGRLYGALYNRNAVQNANLCPTGWHVPTNADWAELNTYLGNNPGGKLKEFGNAHWNAPNTDATNESGFSALPGVAREEDGTFILSQIGYKGCWGISDWPTLMFVISENGVLYQYPAPAPENIGVSVRCIKDK